MHLGGGLTGIILGPIFAYNGLEVEGEFVGGVIYGGSAWAFKVGLILLTNSTHDAIK